MVISAHESECKAGLRLLAVCCVKDAGQNSTTASFAIDVKCRQGPFHVPASESKISKPDSGPAPSAFFHVHASHSFVNLSFGVRGTQLARNLSHHPAVFPLRPAAATSSTTS